MNRTVFEYYRCPARFVDFALAGSLSLTPGYFRFGNAICYGQCSGGVALSPSTNGLYDALPHVSMEGSTLRLPFDPTQVIQNLRFERYSAISNGAGGARNARKILHKAYYLMRPLMSVSVRKLLQKAYLHGRRETPFPRWPVDRTVEDILERLLVLSMKAQGIDKIPFVWFWPDGASSSAMMTHDVETSVGRDFCSELMDIDDLFGIKTSFQIVPEGRYRVSPDFLSSIRDRGFEIGIQDLNHDGNLFNDREGFLHRVRRINLYAKQFGAQGFRSAVLYRNLNWFDQLDFSYDMSVPSAAHLEAQQGGCCTVMPYFIGRLLELPLTTTQDYSLWHILGDFSIEVWKRQIDLIRERHGLISLIIHPDYVLQRRARETYRSLLEHLTQLRSEERIWIALPREVDRWWRQRAQMNVVSEGGSWRICGEGSERARVAYAILENNRLVYEIEQPS